MSAQAGPHRPPRDCPVCADQLLVTRLGCRSCGSELSGRFQTCEFCGLSPGDRDVLRVFLASRGNMKELERHLGVSYPTTRARFDAVLDRLGLLDQPGEPRPEAPPGPPGSGGRERLDVLEALARGELDVDEAQRLLAS